MEKEINKVQTNTFKGTKNRNEIKENPIKVTAKYYNFSTMETLNSNKSFLYDRGDSRKAKKGEIQIKYDGSKINKAIEANFNVIKKANVAHKNGFNIKKNNLNNFQQCSDFSNGTKSKVCSDSKSTENKYAKEQLSTNFESKTGSDTVNTINGDIESRVRLKEVITIPYIPSEDTSNTRLPSETGANFNLKNIASKCQKTVTFKDQIVSLKQTKATKSKTRPIDVPKSGRSKVAKHKRRRKSNSSPSPIKCTINESLPTEVIKWAPSCLTSDTKPYYEAWVDTSLTAFSKCSEKEMMKLEKELQLHKRPVTPELIYERLEDETYTGRIRVRYG